MFIQTEQTPNPASLKFLPGCQVMVKGSAEFTSSEAAAVSPLATRLFKIVGVTGIFLGPDFITVSKGSDAEWPEMKPVLLGEIMEHFMRGEDVIKDEHLAAATAPRAAASEHDSDIVKQIVEILDTRIRPAVAMDGGDIEFDTYDDGIVYLYMRGACAGCPSSTMTLKSGIENLLKHFIPEVKEVRASN
jgi:Fe-S cluster biogenesis protein NfuA